MIAVQTLELRAGARLLMDEVNFRVDKGDKIGLVGRNGAGKTTTLKAIMGVVRARPGRVRLAGVDITQLPTHEIARMRIAQSPEGRRLFPRMSVMENLQMGADATDGGAGRDWMNVWMFARSALDTTFSVYGGIWLVGRRT